MIKNNLEKIDMDTELKNYIENGNNRILIFTDGMFSSGNKEYAKILKTIKLYKHKNIN